MGNMASSIDPTKFSKNIADNKLAMACLMPMGITSENVAEKYGISAEKQNALAANSHAKALAAQKQGLFSDEIVLVSTTVKDKEGKATEVVIKVDEGPRDGTTAESLGKLKAAFKPGGSTTAGNSTQRVE